MCQSQAAPPDPLKNLVSSLRQGANSVPAWFLTHSERWRWLVETLMGHPRIRGDQRPRDFPGDRSSLELLSRAVELHACPLPRWRDLPADAYARFGSWLFPFVLMVETQILPARCGCLGCKGGNSGEDPANAEGLRPCPYPESALLLALEEVIGQTLRAMGLEGDHASLDLLHSSLGLGPVEASAKGGYGRASKACKESIRYASVAAYCAGAEADSRTDLAKAEAKPDSAAMVRSSWTIPERGVHGKERLNALLDGTIWTLLLKTYKVQPFIRRATSLGLARGASAWASQVLAAARDELPRQVVATGSAGAHEIKPLLLTDVGAFSLHAWHAKPDCQATLESIAKGMEDSLQKWNPKLFDFLAKHPDMKREVKVASCFPDLCLEARETSIRKLCGLGVPLDETKLEADRKDREQRRLWHAWKSTVPRAPDPKCHFVKKDRGLIPVNLVPWRRDMPKNPLIGWRGIAWTLAGSTYKAHTLQGLGESLDLPPLQLPEDHRHKVELLGTGQGMAYLLLDGDKVGHKFQSMAWIRGFQAAMSLLESTQKGLLAGVFEVWSAMGKLSCPKALPVELIYLGGDDLVCELPMEHLGAFLDGFQRHATSPGADSFSGVVVRVPILEKGRGQDVPALVLGVLQPALKPAKAFLRMEVTRLDLRTLRSTAKKSGFALTCHQQEVIRHGDHLTVLAMDLRPIPAAPDAVR